MPLNYRLLNLPTNPIKDTKGFIRMLDAGFYRKTQFNLPTSILSEEILDIFDSIEVKIKTIAVFSFRYLPVSRDSRLLHKDVVKVDDQWKPVVCGVNWELTPTESQIDWYDTAREPVYPTDDEPFYYPQGIHYGHRDRLGIFPETDTRLETYMSKGAPFLMRTDVPHIVSNNQPFEGARYSISLRFEYNFASWTEALLQFKPLIKDAE